MQPSPCSIRSGTWLGECSRAIRSASRFWLIRKIERLPHGLTSLNHRQTSISSSNQQRSLSPIRHTIFQFPNPGPRFRVSAFGFRALHPSIFEFRVSSFRFQPPFSPFPLDPAPLRGYSTGSTLTGGVLVSTGSLRSGWHAEDDSLASLITGSNKQTQTPTSLLSRPKPRDVS